MATKKRQSSAFCLAHCLFYVLPFLCLTWSGRALLIIASTHFVIDRFGLAELWMRFWGVGQEGAVTWWWRNFFMEEATKITIERERRDRYRDGDRPLTALDESQFWAQAKLERIEDAPLHIAFVLRVVVDNTFHLLCNALALSLFP